MQASTFEHLETLTCRTNQTFRKTMEHILEVIGFNIESCAIAQAAGAQRIELCDNPGEGGTTPSYGFLQAARKKLSIELFPIIRPRGGDFLYSADDFEIMKKDVLLCRNAGCDGIVMGILKTDGSVDIDRCTQLVEIAYPLGVTFHRAFDRANDPVKAMQDIIACGCERILTSGQQPQAMAGIDLIASLIEKAADNIIIMPGSGVRSENIASIAAKTKAVEFHTSARKLVDSKMELFNPNMNEKLQYASVDKEEIEKIKNILTSL